MDKLSKKDVLEYIIDRIKEKKWDLGDKIYSENHLARNLGVNRSTVREAYSALESIGVIETIQGDGTYLKKIEKINPQSPLSILSMLIDVDIQEVIVFRKIIEIGMIESAMSNLKKKDEEKLLNYLKIMEKENDYKIVSEYDIKIHKTICEIASNPLLSLVFNMIIGYLNYMSDNNWKYVYIENNLEVKEKLYKFHEDMIYGLINRDLTKSTEAIKNHLDYLNNEMNHFYLD